MTGVLFKRGDLDRGRHMQREDGGKAQKEHLEAKECLRLPATGREACNKQILPHRRKKELLCHHLDVGPREL